MMKNFYSRKDAAKKLGISYETIKRYEKKGFLKPYINPINNYRLYNDLTLENFLEEIKTYSRR